MCMHTCVPLNSVLLYNLFEYKEFVFTRHNITEIFLGI